MTLYTPSRQVALQLALEPDRIDGLRVAPGALPATVLFERAASHGASTWLMPYLLSDDASGQFVGSGGFKGEPCNGRVEIGYNVAPLCQNLGFATEGVRLICVAAFSSELVSEVVAATLATNAPSQRVLEKNGFMVFDERTDAEGIFKLWRKTRGTVAR